MSFVGIRNISLATLVLVKSRGFRKNLHSLIYEESHLCIKILNFNDLLKT